MLQESPAFLEDTFKPLYTVFWENLVHLFLNIGSPLLA